MAQQSGLSFTFKRDFTPNQYLTDTQEDLLDIMYFHGCWSLVAKIEDLAREFKLEHENARYLAKNFDFLKSLHHLLVDERTKALLAIGEKGFSGISTIYPPAQYYQLIETNLKDLEWLLFYLTDVIAASQFFEEISDECFTKTSRSDWISMCRAWGNDNPDKFELIFWID